MVTSKLDREILTILYSKYRHPNAIRYSITIHTPHIDIPIKDLASIEYINDFKENVTDYILVNFIVEAGIYVKDILPYSDNLYISITYYWYDKPTTTKYKLVIMSDQQGITGSIHNTLSRSELNKLPRVSVECQAVSRLVSKLRNVTVDGVFTNCNVSDLIQSVMLTEISYLEIDNAVPEVNFNMVPPNNLREYVHISIPEGVHVLDLPSYIQNVKCGVYNADIGTYVCKYRLNKEDELKETVFVYPLYNNKRYDLPGRKLLIVSSNDPRYDNSEYTYLVDGDVVKIIGGVDMRSYERGDNVANSEGSAFIISNPLDLVTGTKLVDDYEVNNDSKVMMKGYSAAEKADSNIRANYVGMGVNIHRAYSEISFRLLSPYQIVWKHCDIELLFPGMPVKFMYQDSLKGVVSITGVLQSYYAKYNNETKTISALLNVMLSSQLTAGNDNVSDFS